MSKSLLHDWESSIEKNKNNTEELLKIAEDIYNTAYARGKASIDLPQGEWINPDISLSGEFLANCSICGESIMASAQHHNFCPNCGADMRGEEE